MFRFLCPPAAVKFFKIANGGAQTAPSAGQSNCQVTPTHPLFTISRAGSATQPGTGL